MSEYLKKLTESMNFAMNRLGMSFYAINRERGLHDFYVENDDENTEPLELAAKTLEHLCEPECNDFDAVICLAVVHFLDEVAGKPPADRDRSQRFTDLKALVSGYHPYEECLRWVQSWYG